MNFKKIIEPYTSLTGTKKEEEKKEDVLGKTKKVLVSKFKSVSKPYSQFVSKEDEENAQISIKKAGETKFVIKNEEDVKDKEETNLFFKLLWMVKKDIMLLIRSRSSALIVLLGPLLLIALVGMAFNTSSLYSLKIGVYSDAYSALTESVVTSLGDEQYSVTKTENEDKCKNGVAFGDYHVCVVFPANMGIGSENMITFYVDESRMNLAYLISNSISSKISSKASELSLGLTSNLLTALSNVKNEVSGKQNMAEEVVIQSIDTNSQVDNIRVSLNNLDLSTSEANFTALEKEIKSIKESSNLSGSSFKELDNLIEMIKIQFNEISTKLNNALNVKASSISELQDVKNKLFEQKSSMSAIKTSLESISTNINSLTVTDAGVIVSPIKSSFKPITAKKTHLSFLFPTLVVLVVMFISLLLASSVVIREKTSLAYFRNFITPTADIWFTLGTYISNILLVILQLLVLFLAAMFFFKGELNAVLPIVTLVLFISASIFVLMGMFFGYLFNNAETSTLATIAAGSLMLFFSNTILPIETLPMYIRSIIRFNPFVLSEDVLKKILLFKSSLGLVVNEVIMLVSFMAIFFVLAFIARQITKRKI